MSNLNISLDMGRVQSSVQAAIRPAVESALSEHNVKKIIEDALKKPSRSAEDDDIYSGIFMRSRRSGKVPTIIEQFVQEGIEEIAREFVQRELRAQRGYIEEGLRKELVASGSSLAKAFARAAEEALKEDWGFELDVKVAHKTKEKDDY